MFRVRLIKREQESMAAKIIVPLCSVILALMCGWVFLYLGGHSPYEVYVNMYQKALGSSYAISETIVKAIPLMIAGLAVSLAFRMNLWNIGAEGQLYMGAFAASGVALSLGELNMFPLLTLMLIASFIAGAFWALIPGLLRAYWTVNETITTLMLNYVAIFWVQFLVYGPWKDPNSLGFPLTPRFSANAYLPSIGDSRVHMGLLVALLIAVIFYLLLKYSRWGYEIRVVGQSQAAANYTGINVVKNILLVMFISGGVAGITGMIEVAGITHRLQEGISPGYGFTAIIVAWLARLNPFAIVLVAFLLGALLVGGFGVQSIGIPFSTVSVLQGAILFFLLAGEIFLKYRLVIEKGEDK